MAHDHLVNFRSETEIAGYAHKVRACLSDVDRLPIDVVSILRFLKGKTLPGKGLMCLRIFEKIGSEPDAKVTFEPLTVHLEEELWYHAGLGDPFSRFVIAHEIGHAVLHNKDAKAFSRKETRFGIFGFNETSAEWQANVFAGHLLAPDSLAKLAHDALHLSREANIEFDRAQNRLDSLNRRKLWKQSDYFGEACRNCANFTLIRSGLKLTCATCNQTSEI